MNDYSNYIALSRYARFIPELNRRETWEETVKRYCDFWKNRFGDVFPYDRVYNAIVKMEVMPSMRALMTAGPALERDEIAGYNCAFRAVEDLRVFDEAMYILMCGTGFGFSVENKFVQKLPKVAEHFEQSDTIISVADSRIGWASAFRELITLLYSGQVPKWDMSKVRSSGTRLKTFGGRASGPEPLQDLFEFTTSLISKAAGRRLSSIECHDLVCKIADIVVVGGVRRSALISLGDLSDKEHQDAKGPGWYYIDVDGQWKSDAPHRALANNSAVYEDKPSMDVFMKEWLSLYQSHSGERGIFNRAAVKKQVAGNGRRELNYEFGSNPCCEIILRSAGLCNLSEVVVRESDTEETLMEKIRIATIIGTFQSTLTNFRYLQKVWKNNAEEERLLGVSLTGIMDNPLTSSKWAIPDIKILSEMKNVAILENRFWADRLGITPSVAITTVKPSGTVSQLVNSASGIHPRYSQYYLRSVRNDKKDPLSLFLMEQGVPFEKDLTNPNTFVFYFPQKSPDDALTRHQVDAIEQLELYLVYKNYYTEHNVSITVYVKEHEWMEVGAWVYRHFDDLCGVSFLPYDTGIYKQAPYTELTEKEYE
ncbi:MAG: ATP cone domain-containing protein, partial [Waterburya sp.]